MPPLPISQDGFAHVCSYLELKQLFVLLRAYACARNDVYAYLSTLQTVVVPRARVSVDEYTRIFLLCPRAQRFYLEADEYNAILARAGLKPTLEPATFRPRGTALLTELPRHSLRQLSVVFSSCEQSRFKVLRHFPKLVSLSVTTPPGVHYGRLFADLARHLPELESLCLHLAYEPPASREHMHDGAGSGSGSGSFSGGGFLWAFGVGADAAAAAAIGSAVPPPVFERVRELNLGGAVMAPTAFASVMRFFLPRVLRSFSWKNFAPGNLTDLVRFENLEEVSLGAPQNRLFSVHTTFPNLTTLNSDETTRDYPLSDFKSAKRPTLRRVVYVYARSQSRRLEAAAAIGAACPNLEHLELSTPPNVCPHGAAGSVFAAPGGGTGTGTGHFAVLRTLKLRNFDYPRSSAALLPASAFSLPALERITFVNVNADFAFNGGAPQMGACLAHTPVKHVVLEGRLNVSAEWVKRFVRPFMDREAGPLALLEARGRLSMSHSYGVVESANDKLLEFQRLFAPAVNNVMKLFVKSVLLDFDGVGKIVDGVLGAPTKARQLNLYHRLYMDVSTQHN